MLGRRVVQRRVAALALGLALATATSVSAASTGTPGSETDDETRAALKTRVYFGMWTSHVRDPGSGLESNSLLGVAFRGFFMGTFVNSYGARSLSAGVQRSFTEPKSGAFATALGYRVGLVSGYDERFVVIAGKTPVLPFMQLVASLDHRGLGVELAYSGLAASIILNWRL